MASLKNSPGEYCLQQKEFAQQNNYLHYKYSQIPLSSKLPGLGINAGNMRGGYFNNILSNNASNIESHFCPLEQIRNSSQPAKRILSKGISDRKNNVFYTRFSIHIDTPRYYFPG